MKSIKLLVLTCAAACGLSAAPQTPQTPAPEANPNAAYNLVGISYTNIGLDPEESSNISMNGFSIGYTHGFSISKKLPLFIETGVKFSLGIHSDSERYYDDYEDYGFKATVTEKLASLSVPVNVAYKYSINDQFSIKPYLGLNVKVNVLGSTTYKVDHEKETMNWYDNDNDGYFKRFQMGWHIGVGAQYSKYYLGLDYGTDFIKLADEISSGTFNLTLGYSF